jgi:hypothetical protein
VLVEPPIQAPPPSPPAEPARRASAPALLFDTAALDAIAEAARQLEVPCRAELRFLDRPKAAELVDGLLVRVARSAAAVDLAIGERLAALGRRGGDRRLGYSSLGDLARERLDLSADLARAMVRRAELLRSRPLLRAALLAGEVTVSAADAVMPVAVRDEEAAWVLRAKRETVRALERAVEVRLAGGTPDGSASPAVGDDDRCYRLVVSLDREKAEAVDVGLAVAGVVVGLTSSRRDRLEAMAMEFDSEYPLENAPSQTWCGGAAARRDVSRDGAEVGARGPDAPSRGPGETAPASAWAVGPQLAVSHPMRTSQWSGPPLDTQPRRRPEAPRRAFIEVWGPEVKRLAAAASKVTLRDRGR